MRAPILGGALTADTNTANGDPMFGNDWQKAQATIVMAHEKRTTRDGKVVAMEYIADVHPSSGAPFRATIPELNLLNGFLSPRVGMTVSVLVKGVKAKFDKDDPQLNRQSNIDGLRGSNNERFAQLAGAAPGSAPGSLAGSAGGASDKGSILDAIRSAVESGNVIDLTGRSKPIPEDPAPRLATLEALHSRGLMTDAEYFAARQHIIDAI